MYTILITNDNEAISSVRTRIMQRSKLVDELHFLTDQTYNDIDMKDYTLLLEYQLPVTKELKSEILTLSDELYKEKYEYKLPIDTCLTKEPGNVELQLTFSKVEMDADGKVIQRVRKISPCYINIIPITAWSALMPDDYLAPIDQKILELNAVANQLADTQNLINDSKADDLSYEDNTLQLMANGKKIGTSHILNQQNEFDIIEFGDGGSDDPNKPSSDDITFIEF